MKLFLQKRAKFFSAGGLAPHWPPTAGGSASKPPKQPPIANFWLCVCKRGKTHKLDVNTDLPTELEDQLSKYKLDMEARFYGLSELDLRKLAFRVAASNNIQTRFNVDKEIAGEEWLAGFLKRHPEI